MTTGPRLLRTGAFTIAILVVLVLCSVAQAADITYNVNTTDDSPIATPGSTTCADALDGKCSLRAAIDAANNNAGNDTITVPAGRYDRTIAADGSDDNSTGDFNVANNGTLTIQGQTGDAKDVIISADGLDRVLEIDTGGTLTATGVTFQDGFTGQNGAGILVGSGAPVVTSSSAPAGDFTTLTLTHSRVLKNVTIDSCGGGIWGGDRSDAAVITLNSSNVDNNNARECGGGIGYTGPGSILSMFDSSVDGNTASVFNGGGIWDNADASNPPVVVSPTQSAALTSDNETLHIERSSVSDNQAPGTDGRGGGIDNHFCDCGSDVGDVNITDSHIDHNFAASAGAGVYNDSGEVNASGTSFNDNTSHDGSGGGIWSDGTGVSLTNSTVERNFAYFDGGGVCNGSGPLTVDGSTINDNQARQDNGGGLVEGFACFFFELGSHKQPADEALTVTNSHVDGNFAGNFGGGVYNDGGDVTIDTTTVKENEARRDQGGGVYNDGGDLEITDSHVDQNKADLAQGGGVANVGGSLVIVRTSVDSNMSGSENTCCGRGGGVYSNGTKKLVVVSGKQSGFDPGTHIVDSSISKNHSFASGGGLWDNTGADIVNTTIANNQADVQQTENDHQGGGIFDHGTGMTLTNVTLAGNLVNGGEGGGIWANNVDPTFTNTIIADNQANFDPSTSDCGGSSYTSNGHNLDGFQNSGAPDQCGLSDGVNGDQTGKHANLGPLQDNGGPTLTRALLDGSPAIDGGDDSVCANLTTDDNTDPHDQRQAHRPAGAACDIGAYEANSLADLAITKSGPAQVTTGGSISYTLHVTNNGPDKILAVHVHDALPGGTTFVSASPSQGTCNSGVDCDLGAIASGGSATITVVVTAPGSATTLTNTATVSGAPTEVNSSNNSASVQTAVVAPGAAPLIQGPAPTVQPGPKACTKTPPRTSISRNGLEAAADTLRFVGRSIDLRCLSTTSLGIKKVQLAIALKLGHGHCKFLKSDGSLTSSRSCSRRVYLAAHRGRVRNGKVPWTFRVRNLNLPNGSYFVIARGTDTNNDVETKIRTYNRKTFTIH